MKKYLTALILLVVFTFSFTSVAFATNDTTSHEQNYKNNSKIGLSTDKHHELKGRDVKDRLKIHGNLLKYDVPPVIKEGRTLIPVRAITNGLGAEVKWDAATKTITITRDDVSVVLILGQMTMLVNGVEVAMDFPSQLISNRTFVPLRFIAQALGDRVDYNDETGDIDICEQLRTPSKPALVANIATWTAVSNENNGYTLRLFRNGIEASTVTVAHDAALSYDFTSQMALAGNYTVKVKALATGDYNDSKESYASLQQVVTTNLLVPAAPTLPVINDTANTFGWTIVAGFADIAQYEYSVNSGTTWQACTANPQALGNNSYATGAVQVRIKADNTLLRSSGIIMVSNAPFTVTTTVTGTIIALNTTTAGIQQVSIMYDNGGSAVTVIYNVLSTTQILLNSVVAQFSGIQLNDAVVATLQDDVLVKLAITR